MLYNGNETGADGKLAWVVLIPMYGCVVANMLLFRNSRDFSTRYGVSVHQGTPTPCCGYAQHINANHNNNPYCLHTIYQTDDFMRAMFLPPDTVKCE